jgi:Fur family transcriptional regulator, ferric uptake regulator
MLLILILRLSMKSTADRAIHFTRQRRLVLEILRESKGHLDAGTLLQKAKTRDAKISQATVYRALARLRDANLIRAERLGENHAHFEPVRDPLHHHFTCLKCGRVLEFRSPQVQKAVAAFAGREKLEITELRLELRGYCAACRPA